MNSKEGPKFLILVLLDILTFEKQTTKFSGRGCLQRFLSFLSQHCHLVVKQSLTLCDLKLNVIEYLYGFKDLQMTILSKKRSLL